MSQPESTTASSSRAASPEAPGLGRRTLGTTALVFMIIAAAAPLTVVAAVIPTSFAVNQLVGLPLVFIMLGICLALFAVGYSAMSVYIHNAGAFYAYVSRGLGRATGLSASWVALIAYNGLQIGGYGMLGYTISSFLGSRFGLDVPWWLCAVVCLVIVAVLGLNRVDLSVRLVAVLVVLESLVVIVFDVLGFVAAPEGVSGAALNPANAVGAGLGGALALCVAAFMGFESAAIYSEEAKDPRRSVGRATFIAIAIIALFYAFAAWATTIGIGPGQVVAEAQTDGPDLMFVFFAAHGGAVLADIGQVLLVTSLLACVIAFHNIVARYIFSLGRENMLPRMFAKVSRRSHAPIAGSLAQSTLALVVLILFAIGGTDSEFGPLYPVLTMFNWLGAGIGALGLVVLLLLTSVAVIGYFARDARGFSVWRRLIAPALASLALAGVLALILVNYGDLVGLDPSSPLNWALPCIVLVPGVAGLLVGLWLKASRPTDYARIGSGEARGDLEPEAGRIEAHLETP